MGPGRRGRRRARPARPSGVARWARAPAPIHPGSFHYFWRAPCAGRCPNRHPPTRAVRSQETGGGATPSAGRAPFAGLVQTCILDCQRLRCRRNGVRGPVGRSRHSEYGRSARAPCPRTTSWTAAPVSNGVWRSAPARVRERRGSWHRRRQRRQLRCDNRVAAAHDMARPRTQCSPVWLAAFWLPFPYMLPRLCLLVMPAPWQKRLKRT